ncbi:Uncharacterised protein [Arcanobacterium haemolyticum]|nr:Uncharacterised protein [Arcanobacterium haemolyticum]
MVSGFTKTDLRNVAWLLSGPSLVQGTMREVSDRAGTSIGSVHNTCEKIRTNGFLSCGSVRNRDRLAKEWVESYLSRGGIHRYERTFYVPDRSKLYEQIAGSDMRLGGELAAEVMGWPIISIHGIVYVSHIPEFLARVATVSPREGAPQAACLKPSTVATTPRIRQVPMPPGGKGRQRYSNYGGAR